MCGESGEEVVAPPVEIVNQKGNFLTYRGLNHIFREEMVTSLVATLPLNPYQNANSLLLSTNKIRDILNNFSINRRIKGVHSFYRVFHHALTFYPTWNCIIQVLITQLFSKVLKISSSKRMACLKLNVPQRKEDGKGRSHIVTIGSLNQEVLNVSYLVWFSLLPQITMLSGYQNSNFNEMSIFNTIYTIVNLINTKRRWTIIRHFDKFSMFNCCCLVKGFVTADGSLYVVFLCCDTGVNALLVIHKTNKHVFNTIYLLHLNVNVITLYPSLNLALSSCV